MPRSDTTRLATPACCHYLLFTDRKWWQMTEEVATQRESILSAAAWAFGGKTEVRRSFGTQGILKIATSAPLVRHCRWFQRKLSLSVSVTSDEAPAVKRHSPPGALWDTSWCTSFGNRYGAMLRRGCRSKQELTLCVFYEFHRLPWCIIQLQSCVMLVHLPWGIHWLPPPSPKQHSPGP